MQVRKGVSGCKLTWQEDFPEKMQCSHCGGSADIAIAVREISVSDMKNPVCSLYGRESGKWPHDFIAIAVYLCRKCLEPTALFNQA